MIVAPTISVAEVETKTDPPPAAVRMLRPWVVALLIASLVVLAPLWSPLVLAAWAAIVVRPLHTRLARRVGGRDRAAAVITVLFSIVVLGIAAAMTLAIVSTALELVESLRKTAGFREAINVFLAQDSRPFAKLDARQLVQLGRTYGAGAFTAGRSLAGAVAATVLEAFVFTVGFYTLLVRGPRAWDWCVARSPIPASALVRFGDVFVETGRGLLIGVGLTAVLQGTCTTLAYLAFGIPHGLVLGFITIFAALIPSIGTGLVWAPLSAVLFFTGSRSDAIFVLVVGCIVSLADNFVRPALARFGHLELPSFVVLVAMLGGIAVFGGSGLLLGPLIVRLTTEGLNLLKEAEFGLPGPITTTSGNLPDPLADLDSG
jgi:predicted PurR-regulated permease PerM